MRRLHLCFVGPANSVSLRRWVDWFAARGHETTILTVEPASQLELGKLRQIVLGVHRGPAKFGRLVSAGRLALALRRLKPDIVHAHYVRGLAWGLLLARWRPYVVTPWGSDVLEEQGAFREWYSRRLIRALFVGADLVTVHSTYLETRVRSLVPQSTRVTRIGWGVDLTRFRPDLKVQLLRRQWGIDEDQLVIFSPRLAQRFYNHDLVICALPAVLEKVPKTIVVVTEQFADQAYLRELKNLSEELGVAEHVRFVGAVPYDEMPLWYNLADAVVMVPRSDGMPNTLLEAMACGAVPVVGRLPQYAELIRHGENGLVAGDEPGQLAQALVTALLEPGLKESMARINRSLVWDLGDQDKEMGRMEQEYLRLAGLAMG